MSGFVACDVPYGEVITKKCPRFSIVQIPLGEGPRSRHRNGCRWTEGISARVRLPYALHSDEGAPQVKIDVAALFYPNSAHNPPQLPSTAKRYLSARVSFACARRAVFYLAAAP